MIRDEDPVHDRPGNRPGDLKTGIVKESPLECTGTQFYEICA